MTTSKNGLLKSFTNRCTHRHTIFTHPKCFNNDGTAKVGQTGEAKILSIDIETLPILAYAWNVWDTSIHPNQVVKDWCLLSYSARWLGSSNTISNVLSPKEAVNRDDKRITEELWKLLEQASIINGHNSRRFDIKKINARFWKHGLHRPSSYRHIDTLVSAKSVFGLTYNKLDFIAEFNGIQNKLQTDMDLWRACDNGDKVALQQMREYNERDVEIQEKVYLSMREWIPNHPNLATYANLSNVCPICLKSEYKEIGLYTTNSRQYQEYRCKCGATWHNNRSIKR